MSQLQIAEVGEFDQNEWDDGGITGLDLSFPEYDGMYGLDQVWPEYEGMYGLDDYGDYGCSSCMAGLDAPPAGALSKPKGGFPVGTVLIGVGGLGLGILAAVLVKKYVLK